MRACVNVDTTSVTTDGNKAPHTIVRSSTWINQENFPINNALLACGESLQVRPGHAKDSYRSDWETSCSAPARLADKFKNSAWGNRGGWWTTFSRRKAGDVAAVEACVKDDVREGIKSRWDTKKRKKRKNVLLWVEGLDKIELHKDGDSDQSFPSGH